jgi:hypothetical protein
MLPVHRQKWWQQAELRDGRARQMRPLQFPARTLPPRIDLRRFMSPVEDQADMSTW